MDAAAGSRRFQSHILPVKHRQGCHQNKGQSNSCICTIFFHENSERNLSIIYSFGEQFNTHSFQTHFVTFGREQETSYHFFRSIGESESEDPTLTETLARRLS